MRNFLVTSAIALGLGACASQAPVPARPAAATPKAPQCWNGDAGAFAEIGVATKISGVEVVCEKTSDGKNAQWMSRKR